MISCIVDELKRIKKSTRGEQEITKIAMGRLNPPKYGSFQPLHEEWGRALSS